MDPFKIKEKAGCLVDFLKMAQCDDLDDLTEQFQVALDFAMSDLDNFQSALDLDKNNTIFNSVQPPSYAQFIG